MIKKYIVVILLLTAAAGTAVAGTGAVSTAVAGTDDDTTAVAGTDAACTAVAGTDDDTTAVAGTDAACTAVADTDAACTAVAGTDAASTAVAGISAANAYDHNSVGSDPALPPDYPALPPDYPASTRYQPATQPDYPDSLRLYIERAARNNPGIQSRYLEYRAALKKSPQAGSLPDPELTAGIFPMPMELVEGRQYAELTLMQMFPWFGVLRNARQEMDHLASARFEEFRSSLLELTYELEKSWYELYSVREEIAVSEESLSLLGTIEELLLTRLKAAPAAESTSSTTGGAEGMGEMGIMAGGTEGSALADLYNIRIEAAALRSSISMLKNKERALTVQFNSYLNREPLTRVFTGDSLMADTTGMVLTILPDTVSSLNPMLRMIDYEMKSWEAHGRMVKGMGLPMMGIGLGYSVIGRSATAVSEMNGKDMIMPMVSLTLPVWRKKQRAMIEEAELMQEAAALNRQAVANRLQADWYQALQMYNDAQQRSELSETQLQLASGSLSITIRNYSVASALLSDVIRLQQKLLEYGLNRVRAVADINIATARLRQIMAINPTSLSGLNEYEENN